MTDLLEPRAIGTPRQRVDGAAKVTGTAAYAYEIPVEDPAYLFAVQSTIAHGRITSVDVSAAERVDGVLAVLTHENAPRLAQTDDHELAVLQGPDVGFVGQFVAAVVAERSEIAREAAGLVVVSYEAAPHDVELRTDSSDLYRPDHVNPAFPTDTGEGDVDAAVAAAAVVVDETYTTPNEHNNPMEPHAATAIWRAGGLELHDSSQGVHAVRSTLAPLFGLDPEQVHVTSPYVGGGFGSKGMPHAHDVLVSLAAQAVPGRPVRFALTRQQMFSVAGHRTPTIQRVRLGADTDGRLVAIANDIVEHTSRVKEFAEQTGVPTRMMYGAPNRRTTHRLAPLDVPVPSWMRAPGETPGMFGPEVALDELAGACGLDPIEVRVRNDPERDPESGNPWSSRRLVDCLREGARRFGWSDRPLAERSRREGDWWVGTGVASSVYPLYRQAGSAARIAVRDDGGYVVQIGAADIGTGSWTILGQIAADALGCPVEQVHVEIADTALPPASVAGGSSGTTSWGSAIVAAAQQLRDKFGYSPQPGDEITAETPDNPKASELAMYSFGAQFAEVRVHADTGEIRVPRMLGVFSVGQIINPLTARSQLIGGMTMGLGMALFEESVLDPRSGAYVTHDLAEYHVPTHADAVDIDAVWLDERDPNANPMGSRGIGEIGIVGVAAAVANAAHHATGIRVRDLPITPDRFVR